MSAEKIFVILVWILAFLGGVIIGERIRKIRKSRRGDGSGKPGSRKL